MPCLTRGVLCGVAKPSVGYFAIFNTRRFTPRNSTLSYCTNDPLPCTLPDFSPVHREDLKNYWQMVVSIDKVVDFAKHHCSAEIKAFLQVDENTRNKVMRTDLCCCTDLSVHMWSLGTDFVNSAKLLSCRIVASHELRCVEPACVVLFIVWRSSERCTLFGRST
jgi:hypothetical protein